MRRGGAVDEIGLRGITGDGIARSQNRTRFFAHTRRPALQRAKVGRMPLNKACGVYFDLLHFLESFHLLFFPALPTLVILLSLLGSPGCTLEAIARLGVRLYLFRFHCVSLAAPAPDLPLEAVDIA